MVRPLKEGLSYFPLDCVMDRKIELLEAEHGLEGFAIYIKLLQECYQSNDGTIKYKYNGFSAGKMYGKRWGKPSENIEKMVYCMVNVGLFDQDEFEKNGILTSNGIKKRIEKILSDRRKDRADKGYRRGKPSDNSPKTPEIESKIEKESKKKRYVRFAPPTLEEVSAYCKERTNGIDANAFIDFYQARGWTYGRGVKVKDWKACMRTWENRDKKDNKIEMFTDTQKRNLIKLKEFSESEAFNES